MTRPIAWFVRCMRHYAQFSGRASRPEYWWFYVVVTAGGLTLNILASFLWSTWILVLIWSVGVVIPHLAVGSRRLHDAGHSFWWAAPPVIGGIVLLLVPHARANGLFLALALVWLGFAVYLVYLLCNPSDEGPNRFGDPAPTAPN